MREGVRDRVRSEREREKNDENIEGDMGIEKGG